MPRRRGRIVGVRIALADEEDAEPWTAPPSRRRKEPPIAGPLPESLELILGDQIYIAKDQLPPGLRNRLLRLAAFQNPEFYKAQAMRLPTYDKPRIIGCAEDHPHHIGLPRGCLEDVQKLLSDLHIDAVIRDERYAGHAAGCRRSTANCGRSKRPPPERCWPTTPAFWRPRPPSERPWLPRGSSPSAASIRWFSCIAANCWNNGWSDCRRFSACRQKPSAESAAAERSRPARWMWRSFRAWCARASSTIASANTAISSWMSATTCPPRASSRSSAGRRRDSSRGCPPPSRARTATIRSSSCSAARCVIASTRRRRRRPVRFEHTVLVRPTSFRPLKPADPDVRIQFHDLYDELIADEQRNRLICDEVVQAVREGRSPLVLTERNEHLDCLAARLSPSIRHLVVLRGGMRPKEAQAIAARLAAIPENEERVLLATGRYIGEGFDDARLDTLFLTLPVSWRGTIAQYVGRLHRLHHRKREVRVYDYADLNVPMLARMFDRRCRGYEAVGYTILLPASAVPGWPADVPLPVDPQWKSDYAASVRRLVRDGVDAPLANLFVHVARDVPPDAEGIDRARSATEAFLYRRLETLPETAGRSA